ncbi:MAG TPA: ROK family protein [Rugosimonospora sp.]|nr:ROK family protein [Rugosimonospora sp.]
MRPSPANRIVLDVGGTTLRTARYERHTGRLSEVRRVPVEGMARHPDDPAAVLQERVVAQIGREIERIRTGPRDPAEIVVAFAGPVTDGGVVTAAPTIWGGPAEPVPLTAELRDRLDAPVVVVNDLTAAAWRYLGRVPEPFCLITVSSGIGNKVVHAGRVMVDPDGIGGELGHWTCDTGPDALPCECGGRGHLGGIASGRGAVALARRRAVRDPGPFRRSVLARQAEIDAVGLARAVAGGDAFALDVLRTGLAHLASAVTALFTAAGICHYVIVGGFAQAIGQSYVDLLAEQLDARGCFGLPPERIRRMAQLGEPDDDHALIGAGRITTAAPEPQPEPTVPGGGSTVRTG